MIIEDYKKYILQILDEGPILIIAEQLILESEYEYSWSLLYKDSRLKDYWALGFPIYPDAKEL